MGKAWVCLLKNMLAAMVLLALLHDLQEFLQRNTTIARDVTFPDDLVYISLKQKNHRCEKTTITITNLWTRSSGN